MSLEAMELARWRAKYAKNTTLTRYGRERAELHVPHRRPCYEPTPIYDALARDARILAREKDRKPPEWLAMVRAEGRKQKRPLSARLGFRRKEAKAEVIERDSFGKRLPSKRPVSAPAGRKPGTLAYRIFGAGKAKPAKEPVDALQQAYEKHGEEYDKFQDARASRAARSARRRSRSRISWAAGPAAGRRPRRRTHLWRPPPSRLDRERGKAELRQYAPSQRPADDPTNRAASHIYQQCSCCATPHVVQQ